MKKLFDFVFIVLSVLQSRNGFAQQVPAIPINTVVDRVQNYFGIYPVEKVHLHFDKPYYAVVDTLWFKSYLQHNLFEYSTSKIVYLEVLSCKDTMIQTFQVPLTNTT